MVDHTARHELVLSLLVLIALALPAFILALFGNEAVETLRYERSAMTEGNWWRGLTCHWVHLGTAHLALNLAGLAVAVLIAGQWLGGGGLLLATLLGAAMVPAGLYVLDSHLDWYVGLSGLIHAIWAAGALRGVLAYRSLAAWAFLGLLAVKTIAEIQAGAHPALAELIGGAVIVQAHWYGAAGGVLAAVLLPRSH
ncbi:MAG: rhombosortase [Ectothiorhodospiraceae bacterium]|nr:rhombosortase [Ectothiorhodospiraceae bacterium]